MGKPLLADKGDLPNPQPVLGAGSLAHKAQSQIAATSFPGIDALRGLAALTVLFLHAREILWIGAGAAWEQFGLHAPLGVWLGYLTLPFSFGATAVVLFFVISGFCIFSSFRRLTSGDASYRSVLSTYARRRLRRIYPTLLLALIFTAVADYFIRRQTPLQYKLGDDSAANFIGNLLSLQTLTSTPYGTNGPLWSLATEEHLYALFPLLFLAWRSYGGGRCLVAALGVSLTAIFLVDTETAQTLDFLPYAFSWLIGALAYEQREVWQAAPRRRKILTLAISLLLGAALSRTSHSLWAAVPLAIGFAVIVTLACTPAASSVLASRGGRLIQRTGALSFSLYVLHAPVLVLYRTYLLDDQAPTSGIHFLLGAALALIVSWLGFQLVEKRSLSARRA